jgi:hypothetical protein
MRAPIAQLISRTANQGGSLEGNENGRRSSFGLTWGAPSATRGRPCHPHPSRLRVTGGDSFGWHWLIERDIAPKVTQDLFAS